MKKKKVNEKRKTTLGKYNRQLKILLPCRAHCEQASSFDVQLQLLLCFFHLIYILDRILQSKHKDTLVLFTKFYNKRILKGNYIKLNNN